MKRSFVPIISIAVALLLIGGLAYALEKKKHTIPMDHLPDATHEEEAFQAELLAVTEEHQNKKHGIDVNLKKIDADRSGVKKDLLKIINNP